MHESTKKLINFVRLRIDEEEEQWRGGCNLKVHTYSIPSLNYNMYMLSMFVYRKIISNCI